MRVTHLGHSWMHDWINSSLMRKITREMKGSDRIPLPIVASSIVSRVREGRTHHEQCNPGDGKT
tara:strand:+ start:791 stop:982 length:192 start_codon:yes stop_codon:yes gene_type:complete